MTRLWVKRQGFIVRWQCRIRITAKMRQHTEWETRQSLSASIILWPLLNSTVFHSWRSAAWNQGLCLSRLVDLGHALYDCIKWEQSKYWMKDCVKSQLQVWALYTGIKIKHCTKQERILFITKDFLKENLNNKEFLLFLFISLSKFKNVQLKMEITLSQWFSSLVEEEWDSS